MREFVECISHQNLFESKTTKTTCPQEKPKQNVLLRPGEEERKKYPCGTTRTAWVLKNNFFAHAAPEELPIIFGKQSITWDDGWQRLRSNSCSGSSMHVFVASLREFPGEGQLSPN
jgi:hypothetical protein